MRVGSIVAIVGPMFSAKTTALQEYARRAIVAGRRILYLIPECDTRFDAAPVAPLNRSHDGATLRATRIQGSLEHVDADDSIDYIFIDEAQFVHGVEAYALRQRDAGKVVYIACLRTSFTGAVWENTNNLISAHADEIIVKTGVCIVCSGDAQYTRLKTNSIRGVVPVELIGGDELYACACHKHAFEPVTLDEAIVGRRNEALQQLRSLKEQIIV